MPGILKRRTRRLGIALCVAAFAAGACAPADEQPDIPVNAQGDLLIQVVDQLYDAGRGASVALNKDGSPAVSYLLYKPVLKAGDIPPAVVPGQPQPPAVILATLAEGVWNRASVTPQINNPAQGDAPGLANDQGQAIPGTTTGIAVDAQDKHHLVWSTPKGGLFYADDTAGNSGEAEEITRSPAYGASIALSQNGSPWISFYAGGSVRAAQRTAAGNWTTEDVQRNAGPAAAPATVTAIRVTPNGEPVVAYGDQGKTVVARRTGGSWTTEQVPGDGGYGVSLALDKNGNPSVAFYDTAGNVHLARSSGGGPWDVADLGATGPPKAPPSDIRWATGVAIDEQGTTFATWANTKANQIMLAANRGDTPTSQAVPGSASGTNPSLAVSADGKSLALAWFDGENANLEVAQGPPPSELTLAHPLTPAPTPTGGGQPTAPPAECEPDGTTIQIAAQNIAFDKNCLAAPAGKSFTIEFNNQEPVPHNVEIFTDSSATTRLGGATGPGDIATGPTTVTYQVDALDPGTYYFQCDVHPAAMNGTFVVK